MGYIDFSMSENAADAYENGEMPASKWTRKNIAWLYLRGVFEPFDVELFFKARPDMDDYLVPEGWHHTSKFYNTTDFYSFDSEKASENFPGDGRDFCVKFLNALEARRAASAAKKAAAEEAARKKDAATRKRILTLWKSGRLPAFKISRSGKSISGFYGKTFYQIFVDD